MIIKGDLGFDIDGNILLHREMAPNTPVDKLADNLKSLVISASGNIPGFSHGKPALCPSV